MVEPWDVLIYETKPGRGDSWAERVTAVTFTSAACFLTCQVVVLLALVVRQRHELPEQQRVLEHSLNRLDEVGLEGGGMLFGGITSVQKSLEGLISFSYKQVEKRAVEEHSRMD